MHFAEKSACASEARSRRCQAFDSLRAGDESLARGDKSPAPRARAKTMKVMVIVKHLYETWTLVLISLHGKHHVVKRRTPGNDLKGTPLVTPL
jgi:hypothetical protein